MKQLTVVVKPFRAEAVLRAVAELGVASCVVREAKGYSRQKGYLARYAGSEYSVLLAEILAPGIHETSAVIPPPKTSPPPEGSASPPTRHAPPAHRWDGSPPRNEG
jgi:hypothetical protein